MERTPSHRQRYNRGYLLGIIVSAFILLLMFSPLLDSFRIGGPMLVGHENLQCIACHKKAQGSLRQQLQANVQYLLHNRPQSTSVGFRPVENSQCVHCHDRPNDRHPVYRFLEPKYRKVRENIGAHTCAACHREHSNKRLTVKPDFCQHCHDELAIQKDPLETTHAQLIDQQRWSSCLTCHDYHANHKMKTPDTPSQAVSITDLENYFNRGKQAYPGKIIHKAKTYDYEIK